MTQRQAIHFTRLQLLEQYRSSFPELVSVAENSDVTSFKDSIAAAAYASDNREASETVLTLLRHDA